MRVRSVVVLAGLIPCLLSGCGGLDDVTLPVDPCVGLFGNPDRITISLSTTVMEVGDTAHADATLTTGDKYFSGPSPTFSSDNPTVVTASAGGTLIARHMGRATITATACGLSDDAFVTVVAPASLGLRRAKASTTEPPDPASRQELALVSERNESEVRVR